MIFLFFFIINISNIIFINSRNETFISELLRRIVPINNYQKLIRKYNINIQIIEDKNITNEFFVNTSYISDEYPFDFFYKGKFYYLNDTKIDFLSRDNYNNNLILLIRTNSSLNNIISNNRNLIRYSTRVIIIPKNSIDNIGIIAEYCLYDLSIYLIELEENLFNQIIDKYILTNKYNYYAQIISKKYEVFPYIGLYSIMLIISLSLLLFSFFYKYTIKKFENHLKEKQIQLFKEINGNIDTKIYINFLLFIELNIFYNEEGFIFDTTSFLKSLTIIIMIISKAALIFIILNIFYGVGLMFSLSLKYKALNFYLGSSIILFYIFSNVFVSPLRIPIAFYIFSIFIYTPYFLAIVFYSFKNLYFLFTVLFKIKKIERFYKAYGPALRIKIFIIFIQFIIFLIYLFLFLVLHEYLLFKNGLCFEIEKDILFQCLDNFFILLISLIYIPRKYPVGFDLYILIIKDNIKNNKIQIKSGKNYQTNIPKDDLTNEKEIKNFIKNNYQNKFSILNPKVFFDRNKENKDISLHEKNINIGKLIPIANLII